MTQDDKLVGIFSERDVLTKINTRVAELAGRPVSEFMTREPAVTGSVTPRSRFALHRMGVGHYRHVPITDAQSRPSGDHFGARCAALSHRKDGRSQGVEPVGLRIVGQTFLSAISVSSSWHCGTSHG